MHFKNILTLNTAVLKYLLNVSHVFKAKLQFKNTGKPCLSITCSKTILRYGSAELELQQVLHITAISVSVITTWLTVAIVSVPQSCDYYLTFTAGFRQSMGKLAGRKWQLHDIVLNSHAGFI